MSDSFFFHDPLTEGEFTLSAEESHHALAVRRLRPGDSLTIVDGRGGAVHAEILRGDGQGLRVRAGHVDQRDRAGAGRLTIATALPKGKRRDYLFEKCAELGVGNIWAVGFARSIVRVNAKGLPGWERTCREAMKQSRQSWLPALRVLESAADLPAGRPDPALGMVASTSHDAIPIGAALQQVSETAPVLGVIGPEGGLTEAECEMFRTAGFVEISLGAPTLRIETACVALACHVTAQSAR